MSIPKGTLVGPFEILLPLGSGGMGEVYRARDTRLERDVALKVLPKQLIFNREGLIRFAQEARSASSLNHPNIVTIFEIGTADSSPFLAMELIDGLTLRELLEGGPLPIRKALDLGAQIADGLSKAHQAGIVHRDLKPENIMVTKDGFAKILDFGVAKLQAPPSGPVTGVTDSSLTQAGFIIGTPDYMSPEQASGRTLDFRSDQFSLGLILYEMLTGRQAFHRSTTVQTLSAIIQDDPEPWENFNARVPPPLRWLVERCLSKDPDDRYSSSRDLARELKQIRERAGEFAATSVSRVSPSAKTQTYASAGTAATTLGPPGVSGLREPQQAAAEPRPRARPRRLVEFLLVLLIGAGLFAGGIWTGIWFRDKQIDPPPPAWKADLLLGAMTRVMAPRVSPDGNALAFVTLVGGVSHVAVMKPGSGDWTVLTRPGRSGSVHKVCWSRDGNKLFFDRVSDVPHGVFSIPPLGGEERMVLEDAQGPEALADGSLLVVKRNAQRNFAIHRFWPETGKLTPVGPPIAPESGAIALRAFPDGRRAIFWGRLAGTGGENPRRVYLLELEAGRATPFAAQIPVAPPIAIGPDGSSVLAFITSGDLQQLVSVSGGGDQAKLLFPVTGKPWYLDAGPDGSLYVDTMDNPAELLRFTPAGGVPERITTTAGGLLTSPVELPGGGLLIPSQVLGRRRLLVATAEGVHPFLDINEQATLPAAVLGDRLVAFLSGGVGKPPLIALASIAEGRIVRRLEASRGAAPHSLAASPDGTTLFYVSAGSLFSILIDGGPPKRLLPANGVAVDPRGPSPSLIVQLNDVDGVKLSRVAIAGGAPQPLLFWGPLRLTPSSLSGAAVGPDGRIAVGVTSNDSWFRGVGLLDPATGAVERVPVPFDGDIHYPGWARDGSLIGMGITIRTTLWRFRPHVVEALAE